MSLLTGIRVTDSPATASSSVIKFVAAARYTFPLRVRFPIGIFILLPIHHILINPEILLSAFKWQETFKMPLVGLKENFPV